MKYPQLVSMPSAVSDWLEEQLEALGIDSEVYARYILSLLHAHTLDLIYPEDELPFSGLKKSGEVESLVDELCEKLKKVNSEGDNSTQTNTKQESSQNTAKPRKISHKELADKYYAAFPPLNQKEGSSYFSSNINFVVGKWPSPTKGQIDLITAKWSTPGSPKKNKRKPKKSFSDNTMKPTTKIGQNRNRLGCKRTHSGRNLTKEMADNIANWEFIYSSNNNNNNYQQPDQCLESLSSNLCDDIDMDENNPLTDRLKFLLKNYESEKLFNYFTTKNNAPRKTRLYEKKNKYIPLYPSAIWSDNEDNCENWSDMIMEKGKTKQKSTLACNAAPSLKNQLEYESAIREEYRTVNDALETVECAIKDEYDMPPKQLSLKEHYESDVGSQTDINCNEERLILKDGYASNNALTAVQTDEDDFNTGIVTSDDLERQVNELIKDSEENNEGNDMGGSDEVDAILIPAQMEDDVFNFGLATSLHGQVDFEIENFENMLVERHKMITTFVAQLKEDVNRSIQQELDSKTMSLMMVNHSLENSAFHEYGRQEEVNIDGLLPRPFSHPFGRPIKRPHPPADKLQPSKLPVISSPNISEDQKRTSPNMYFEPIKSAPDTKAVKTFKDGTTFNIRGSPTKINYQRTATGSLFLETELGECRKYFEYNWQSPNDTGLCIKKRETYAEDKEFQVKYWVSPNNKSCQTGQVSSLLSVCQEIAVSPSITFHQVEKSENCNKEANKHNVPTDELSDDDEEACIWATSKCSQDLESYKEEQYPRPDSIFDSDEVIWGYAPKSSDVFCKHCNGKHPWPDNSIKKLDIDLDERALKNIWGVTETCGACPWTTKVPTPLAETTTKLREEMKEEAERLLSDLSSLQLSYSTRLLEIETNDGPSEKKRRHSYVNSDTGTWSFATRLQDCFLNASTVPTRRSVTL